MFNEEEYIQDLFAILNRESEDYNKFIKIQTVNKGNIGILLYLLEEKLKVRGKYSYNSIKSLIEKTLKELDIKDGEVYTALEFLLMKDFYYESLDKNSKSNTEEKKENLMKKAKNYLEKGKSMLIEETIRQSYGFILGTVFGKIF